MLKVKKIFILGLCTLLITLSPVSGVLAVEDGKININTASVEKLMKLKRIGPVYAKRIIEYRKKYGKFEKPGDIMKVRGIGIKTWEANRDIMTVE
ncbi:MAG: helix-hairpin-helix domain-containing protein [Deltaproteobacteria bacterium]|nr:MAG: helix-hairpin-helix domain-containing protein [Deltaproteobacteria bacterium]